MFAKNIMLVDESKDGVNAKLEKQLEALESKVLKISHTKMVYMHCNFSGDVQMRCNSCEN